MSTLKRIYLLYLSSFQFIIYCVLEIFKDYCSDMLYLGNCEVDYIYFFFLIGFLCQHNIEHQNNVLYERAVK